MGQIRIKVACVIAAIVVVLGSVGCSATPATVKADVLQSDEPRAAAETASVPELVAGNTEFALDLYKVLYADANMFFSPYSISTALAMTYAGAQGITEAEMAQALHFTLAQEPLHGAFNALEQALAGRGASVEQESDKFELHVANALWGQKDFDFLPVFLDTLAANYGAGMRILDFAGAAEDARQTINRWVEEQTQDKIKDLLPEGSLDSLVRLVLTNAVYFKAGWASPFEESATKDAPFTLLDGSTVTVPTMRQTDSYGYTEGAGFQAVELPYVGNELSMVIILPDAGKLQTIVRNLNAKSLTTILSALQSEQVDLSLPRWKFEAKAELADALASLGMKQAFTGDADLSGMTDQRDLYIDEVYHKAFVAVDEKGTEAAAATAVVARLTSAPMNPTTLKIDHPFIFLIRDIQTGTILFMGQVVDPA